MWVEPDYEWGWFIVPDVGEVVEIEVMTGAAQDEQMGQSSIDALAPRWRRRYWTNEEVEGQDTPRPVPEDFTATNYGKRRGFATPLGHILMFDDTPGKAKLSCSWTDGKGKYSFLGIEPDGSLIIGTATGHTIFLNNEAGELSIIDQHGNTYTSNGDHIAIISKDSNVFEMKGQNIQILAQAGATVSCKNAVLDAGKVELGGAPAVDAIIKGTTFNAALNTFLAALSTYAGADIPIGPNPGGAALITAISSFQAALAGTLSLKSFTQ
jgi:hypothetical protein